MAKNSIRDYSATSSLNTDVQSVDISEGCAASGINNAIREVMADLKDVSSGTIALESPQADSLTVTGDLTVDTNTLYVDSANNSVGIGTAAPSTKIHLNESGSANAVQRIQAGTNGYAAQLHLYGNNVGGAAYNSVASYVNGDSTPQWEITGPEALAEDQMLFHTGGAERMRILAGGGLTFNGDTAAANALDSYETGSFTPVAIGETTAGSGTYNYQVGEYVKIGKLVHFQISIQWSSHSGSGALRIQSLPFTSDSTTNNFASISAYISELPVTSNHRTMPFIRPNVTYISINQASGSGGPSSVGIDAAAQVLVSGSYLSA